VLPGPGEPANPPILFKTMLQQFINSDFSDYDEFAGDYYTTLNPVNPGAALAFSVSSYINANIDLIAILLATPDLTYGSLVSRKKVADHGIGYARARYIGSQIRGADFNVDSPETLDGGPVVRIRKTTPGQVVIIKNKPTINTDLTKGQAPKNI
jgi:hypothetical protein